MAVANVPLGTQLGKYRITRLLGKGGMGIVYAGEDTHLGRPVAIKLLMENVAHACRGRGLATLLGEVTTAPGRLQEPAPGVPAGRAAQESEALGRFLLEARAAARLNHPNVVTIHDIGRHDNAFYIVMELLGGGSAQAQLEAHGPMPWPLATRLIADVCCGLAAAHAAGLIHRDVKPANFLLADDGTAKLADFGLIKAPTLVPGRFTQPGTVIGTPQYMSPEHCTNERLDERTDIYALGAAYYSLLVGHPPFDGDDPAMIMYAHCSAPVPDPSTVMPGLPAECSRIIARAMAKARSDRFPGAEEMLRDLRKMLVPTATALPTPKPATEPASFSLPELRPPRRQRRIALVVGVPVIVLVALGLVLGSRFFTTRPPALPPVQDRNSPALAQEPGKEIPINANRRIGLRQRSPDLSGHQGEVTAVSLTATRLVSAGLDGKVCVWESPGGALQHTLPHPNPLEAVALSPDGNVVVAGGGMKTVFLWNAVSGERLGTLSEFPNNITSLAFSPSGKQLAVASETDLQLFDFEPPARFTRHARLLRNLYQVSSVAYSRDGKKLAACTGGGLVFVWDLPSLRRLTGPDPFPDRLTAVAVADDGANFAVGRHRGEVHVWKPGTPPTEWSENGGCVSSMAFAPGSSILVVAGEWGGPLRLCNLATGRTGGVPVEVNGAVRGLSFSPDGLTLAAACSDGKVRWWDVLSDERSR
jgi:serine/threonine protein kinase